MNVALICCGRLENRYAIEFVDHYRQLGIDHIYICDNNHDGEEHFEDVLQSYIDNQYVTIINYRNGIRIQFCAYMEVYYKISNNYDWVLICDFDEFLILKEDKTVKEYLSRDCFKNYNQILINWIVYSDNNLIYDDGRPCLERFTTESKYIGHNGLVKPFIRTNIESIYMNGTVHHFYDNNKLLMKTTCNDAGETLIPDPSGWEPINYDLAYFKHFKTKTIEEFINNKCIRGTADLNMEGFKHFYKIDTHEQFETFFEYNDITDKKLDYLEKRNFNVSRYRKLYKKIV